MHRSLRSNGKRQLAERNAQIGKVADASQEAIDVMHSHGVEPDKADDD